MAVIKGTFSTNLKGRVGSVVYRNRGGVNVASQIPANVKNPQSILQQKQRMKFNSVSQAYSCLKGVVDHSFEGVTYGAPSMAKFMKDNALLYTLDGPKHGFVAKGNSALAPGAFKISQGSLPSIGFKATDDGIPGANPIGGNDTTCIFDNLFTMAAPAFANVRYTDLLAVLNMQKGDQLTLISVVSKKMSTFGANSTIPQLTESEMKKVRFVFSEDASDTTLAFISSGGRNIINPAILTESENSTDVEFLIGDDKTLAFAMSDAIKKAYAVYAYGVIASRRSGSTWLRSTQYLDPVPKTMWSGLLPEEKPEYNSFIIILSYDPTSSYYLNGE